jgi:hypothetical protein
MFSYCIVKALAIPVTVGHANKVIIPVKKKAHQQRTVMNVLDCEQSLLRRKGGTADNKSRIAPPLSSNIIILAL